MRKFLIIIVIYNREIEDVEPLKYFINNEMEDIDYTIYIYDNSPLPHKVIYNKPNIVYKHNPQNVGVSKAYNMGAEYGKSNNYDWLILFDQDTQIKDTDFLKYVNKSICLYPQINIFVPIVFNKNGVMSPMVCRYFRPTKEFIRPGIHTLNHISFINSGLIISLESFTACGGYNESTFLDFSDYQFIERLQTQDKFFCIINCFLFQEFSNDEQSCEKLFSRFKLYCKGIKNYDTNYVRCLILHYTGFLHSLALFRRTRKIKFVTYYLLNLLK